MLGPLRIAQAVNQVARIRVRLATLTSAPGWVNRLTDTELWYNLRCGTMRDVPKAAGGRVAPSSEGGRYTRAHSACRPRGLQRTGVRRRDLPGHRDPRRSDPARDQSLLREQEARSTAKWSSRPTRWWLPQARNGARRRRPCVGSARGVLLRRGAASIPKDRSAAAFLVTVGAGVAAASRAAARSEHDSLESSRLFVTWAVNDAIESRRTLHRHRCRAPWSRCWSRCCGGWASTPASSAATTSWRRITEQLKLLLEQRAVELRQLSTVRPMT